MESQCQVTTTPCETGMFSHTELHWTEALNPQQRRYYLSLTRWHGFKAASLWMPGEQNHHQWHYSINALCVPKEAHIFLQQSTWVLVARTVGKNDNDNTGLVCKLLSSIPVIQDPVGLKMLISIRERAAYSCCFYYMKWHNNIGRKVNLCLAPQILAFFLLLLLLFVFGYLWQSHSPG